jgi:2-hydroxychromene-2-carboxylate isomerase
MTAPIEFWFDFASPYAYFAAMEVEDRLAQFGRPVLWRPFLLGVALQKTGMAPLTHMPMRGDYARRDWARIAAMLNLPFILRDDHPFPSQALARAVYWFLANKPEHAVPFIKAAFKTYFGLGYDLREAADVIALAADFAGSGEPVAEWLASDEAKRTLRERTDEAIAKGIFGSPFFLADNEPFWGWDRLPMLEDWLTHGKLTRG